MNQQTKRTTWLALGLIVAGLLVLFFAVQLLFGPRDGALDPEGGTRDGALDDPPPLRGEAAEPVEVPPPGLEGRPVSPGVPQGPVDVTAVDVQDAPLVGQPVTSFVGDEVLDRVMTDAAGQVQLGILPWDGTAWVALGTHDVRPRDAVRVRGGKIELRGDAEVLLRVLVMDAEGGRKLQSARWTLASSTSEADDSGTNSGDARRVRYSATGVIEYPVRILPLESYVDWDIQHQSVVSRLARELLIVHPLRREAKVTVGAVDEKGEDVHGFRVTAFHIAGSTIRTPRTGPVLLGAAALRDVPHYAGANLTVWVESDDDRIGQSVAALPQSPHETLEIAVTVRKRAENKDDEVAWLETDNDLPFEESLGAMDVRDAASSGGLPDVVRGHLEIEALRHDGALAPGVQVRVPGVGTHRTDAAGLLRLEGLREGDYALHLEEVGLLPARAEATVIGDTTARVTLREPDGATVYMTVETKDGRPAPFARFDVYTRSSPRWVDLDGDVQRLDHYTDERGKRILRRVEAGPVVLDAYLGDRRARMELNLEDRETREVTIVIE